MQRLPSDPPTPPDLRSFPTSGGRLLWWARTSKPNSYALWVFYLVCVTLALLCLEPDSLSRVWQVLIVVALSTALTICLGLAYRTRHSSWLVRIDQQQRTLEARCEQGEPVSIAGLLPPLTRAAPLRFPLDASTIGVRVYPDEWGRDHFAATLAWEGGGPELSLPKRLSQRDAERDEAWLRDQIRDALRQPAAAPHLPGRPLLVLRAGAAQRCSYCLDDLGGHVHVCGGCSTVVHTECAAELVECPSVGCDLPPRLAA